jgi:predicted Zn-dependent protease
MAVASPVVAYTVYNCASAADRDLSWPNLTMTSAVIANLQKLIGTPRDGALLRFSLGNEYLKQGDAHNAELQLREALARDPAYSAAWKLLGRTLAETGQAAAALDAYTQGIAVAERRGDLQAAKEMTVFAKRIRKQLESGQSH